jgi:uncharacterized protein YkwD
MRRVLLLLLFSFILTVPLYTGDYSVTLEVKSDQKKKVYVPVWIEKGEPVRFSVSGRWTMWHPSWNAVGAGGHTHFKRIGGYHLGTLMGMVMGGEPFLVRNGMRYTSKTSGYLVLYPHREKYYHLKTSGTLRVTVTGAQLKERNLTADEERVLRDYRENYLASEIDDLKWTGSVRGCRAGSLPPEVLKKAEQRINYFRRMVGLYPVKLDPELNDISQATALIMLARKDTSHYPGKNWPCYSEKGALGARKSNLGRSATEHLITDFIEDKGASNTYCGHRRWLLYSRSASMGFGAAYDPRHYMFAANALYVVNSAPSPLGTVPEFIAYPPAGPVVDALVFPRWSFSLPARNVDFSGVRVRLTGSDGKPVPIIQHPIVKRRGDPSVTWDIDTRRMNFTSFIARNTGGQVTVDIRNVKVNGEAKDYRYQVKIIMP